MGRYEMTESRFALATRIIPIGRLMGSWTHKLVSLLIVALFMSASAQVRCDTSDDDPSLEFHWSAATGSVDHYNVYVSINGAAYSSVGTTSTAPTAQNPYALPIVAEDGKTYQLQVEAEDAKGTTGPMSDSSDLVWCKLRSPGDVNGQTVGDADGNLRVSAGDWAIMCLAWGLPRGNSSFDYRADFNYDDTIDILDLTIVGSRWGNVYSGTAGSPMPVVPVASGGKCKIRLIGGKALRVGEESYINIVIEGAEDIYAMDFEVSFDPALVKVEEIERGTFFSTASGHKPVTSLSAADHSSLIAESWIAGEISQGHGRISPTLTAVPLGSSDGMSGDGVIATLKLTAISGGVSPISLKNIHAYDSKLNPIAATPIAAALEIEAAEYLLAQNYPNPFNPETWIPYALAEECERVTVIIYGVLGEEIRRLDLGHRNAGFYTTKARAAYWDGKNEDGIEVASGVYFYQIKAGDFSAVRKMVVLR